MGESKLVQAADVLRERVHRMFGKHAAADLAAYDRARSEAPSEKPIPDAPGWWVWHAIGRSPRLLMVRRSDTGTLLCGFGPVRGHEPGRWYGPLPLPWEANNE